MSEYGMPYQGSKSTIAASLVAILPPAEHFYDLFGGGGSISHYVALRRADKYRHVHYNEIQKMIFDLLQRAINGDFSYERLKPKWITREEFHANPNNGYIRCCWSFGNGMRTYLFGKHIEDYKRSAHQAVVFDEFDEISESILGFDQWPKIANTITKKRIFWRQRINYLHDNNLIPDLKNFGLPQLRQLQQLERLEQLQQLERLEQLHLTNLSYESVKIEDNSLIYCDIPYRNTKCVYGEEFDHKLFYDWAMDQKNPVYISEYSMNDPRFKKVYTIEKMQLAGVKKLNNAKAVEKLYWNGRKL